MIFVIAIILALLAIIAYAIGFLSWIFLAVFGFAFCGFPIWLIFGKKKKKNKEVKK